LFLTHAGLFVSSTTTMMQRWSATILMTGGGVGIF